MKTGKFVWMFIALMLGSTVIFGQGRRNVWGPGYNTNFGQGNCLNIITDLTTEQKEKISALITAHQEEMAELRVKQRSAFEPVKKNAIRDEMLLNVQSHRDEVRKLLNQKQQEQYDAIQAQYCYGGRRFLNARNCNRRPGGFGGRGGRRGW